MNAVHNGFFVVKLWAITNQCWHLRKPWRMNHVWDETKCFDRNRGRYRIHCSPWKKITKTNLWRVGRKHCRGASEKGRKLLWCPGQTSLLSHNPSELFPISFPNISCVSRKKQFIEGLDALGVSSSSPVFHGLVYDILPLQPLTSLLLPIAAFRAPLVNFPNLLWLYFSKRLPLAFVALFLSSSE